MQERVVIYDKGYMVLMEEPSLTESQRNPLPRELKDGLGRRALSPQRAKGTLFPES